MANIRLKTGHCYQLIEIPGRCEVFNMVANGKMGEMGVPMYYIERTASRPPARIIYPGDVITYIGRDDMVVDGGGTTWLYVTILFDGCVGFIDPVIFQGCKHIYGA